MKVGEVAKFACEASQTTGFIQLAIVLRKEDKKKKALQPDHDHDHDHDHDEHCSGDHSHGGHSHGGHSHGHSHGASRVSQEDFGHSCGANFFKEMQENADLFRYQEVPLEFEFELLGFQGPGSYQREAWEMSNREKFIEVPKLKEVGNALYKEENYALACERYSFAIGLTEALTASTEWEKEVSPQEFKQTGELDLVLRLNYAACKIKQEEYPEAITQCSEVLKRDKGNQKALFRRGQAYLRMGRELELAQKDFDEVAKVNAALPELKGELALLQKKFKAARDHEKKMFSNIFQ